MNTNRIYVCEWVKQEFSFMDMEEKISILKNFDFTYHENFEQAKNISDKNYNGYLLAKGKTESNNKTIPEIQCECIWVYDNNFSIGRYVRQSDDWIYDAYCESWHNYWEEMIMIPTPLLD